MQNQAPSYSFEGTNAHGMQDVQMSSRATAQPPPRKQNTACDACRARKVKCNKTEGALKCQHCLSKNYPCTHHVQQATADKKKNAGQSASRKPRTLTAHRYAPPPMHDFHHLSTSPPVANSSSARQSYTNGGSSPPIEGDHSSASPPGTIPLPLPPHIKYRHGFYPAFTLDTPSLQVLDYLFSPPDGDGDGNSYAEWGEKAEDFHDSSFRVVFAFDLVEVFFQIVHPRSPFLDPETFRQRLTLQLNATTADNAPSVNPALLATVIAWGTKFFQSPVLVRNGGKSPITTTVIERARELAEAMKVHRNATPENICISLLMEPLQSQNPRDSSGFHGFWLSSALGHLLELRMNHALTIRSIPNKDDRGMMIFAWWFSLLADAYHSVYYRRKPRLDEDDYDIDFYVDATSDEDMQDETSARNKIEAIGYFQAAHALARIARQISRKLWIPVTEAYGIPLDTLHNIMGSLDGWQKQYLNRVGMPGTDVNPDWGFIAAISASANDSTFHLHWIILFNALDDFGILEEKGNERSAHLVEINAVKARVFEKAQRGASRVSTLAGVLAANEYLKLDPAVMHVSCIQAGTLLARLGNSECISCVGALRQYSYAYEEAGFQAEQMQHIYTTARAGKLNFKHMSSHVFRSPRRESGSLADALTPMVTN